MLKNISKLKQGSPQKVVAPPIRLIQRQDMNSLPPEAFLRISEYFDLDVEAGGGGAVDDQQVANDSNEEMVNRDLKMLEEVLSQYEPVFMELNDPKKMEEQKRRNRKMRKTSM